MAISGKSNSHVECSSGIAHTAYKSSRASSSKSNQVLVSVDFGQSPGLETTSSATSQQYVQVRLISRAVVW